jgi:predicted RNA binding protein YcfA (HicA-like mRNA interferase family)
MPYTEIPAITGPQLVRLLEKDGWKRGRFSTHGQTMNKKFPDKTRVTIIPTKKSSLIDKTLSLILSPRQTGIGKHGLLKLLNNTGYHKNMSITKIKEDNKAKHNLDLAGKGIKSLPANCIHL